MHCRYCPVVLIAVIAGTIGSVQDAEAADLFARPPGSSTKVIQQWPVLRSQEQSVLGLYGGLTSAYSVSGQLESATLLILSTGYLAPLLGDGSLATFPVAYFDQPGCKGREYLSSSGDYPGLLPLAGIVYRSLSTGQAAYLPKGRASARISVKSILRHDAQQGLSCEAREQTLTLLAAEENLPAVTGMAGSAEVGPVDIAVQSASGSLVKPDRRSDRDSGAGFVKEDPEMTESPQAECSPGCLEEVIGNGSCDIACYYDACRYDGGDCAAMSKDDLDAALGNMCAPGCNREDIGDGFCDKACQTNACNDDGGDCASR